MTARPLIRPRGCGSALRLAVFAEFEADLLKLRTREGMAVARSKGKLKGKKPKLPARQQAELVRMRASGEYSIADLMEMFSVAGRRSAGSSNAPAKTVSAGRHEPPRSQARSGRGRAVGCQGVHRDPLPGRERPAEVGGRLR